MMNRSEFLAITCTLLKGWENLCAQGPLGGFGFASYSLKNWLM